MPVPSNTLLIEGSFSELAEELAQYLDNVAKTEAGAGISADIEPLLSTIREAEQSTDAAQISSVSKQKDEVLKKVVTKAAILNTVPEREFTAAYNLLISLSTQSQMREQLFARICQYLSEKPVSSSPQYGPSLAISTLTTIFNILPVTSEARYHVFLAILKVIKATTSTQAFEGLAPQLDANVSNWLAAWQLDEEDARNLYLAIADVASITGNTETSYRYLLGALETVSPANATDAEVTKLAKRVLITALTNPTILDFTPLTSSDAIQGLRKTDSNLADLLEIFTSDDYATYAEFIESTPLSSLSIPEGSAEVLSKKIRLLTLATICASATNRSVTYSAIAEALQVPADDVEMWVIDTIRAGLVEGKLSQMKQEFLIHRATYRIFGEKQWTEIQGRLTVWRRSLESVLSVVRSEKEKFAREGMGSYDDENKGRQNGYQGEGGQRRQGGRRGQRGERNDQQQSQQQASREVDVGGD